MTRACAVCGSTGPRPITFRGGPFCSQLCEKDPRTAEEAERRATPILPPLHTTPQAEVTVEQERDYGYDDSAEEPVEQEEDVYQIVRGDGVPVKEVRVLFCPGCTGSVDPRPGPDNLGHVLYRGAVWHRTCATEDGGHD